MYLFAAILSGSDYNNHPEQLRGLGKARAQVNRLKSALEAADLKLKELVAEIGGGRLVSYHAVFLAPEYFFSNRRWLQDRFFDQTVKRYIVTVLQSISSTYKDFLIIPGTVLWTKYATDENTEKTFERIQEADRFHTSKIEGLQQKYAEECSPRFVERSVWKQRYGFGRAHQGLSGKMEALSCDVPDEYLSDITHTSIAQNVAYVCKGGMMLKYHKVGNYKELKKERVDQPKRNLVFAPGMLGGRFRVGGVTYGLEICMDHWLGVLKGSGSAVDIHILVSAYTPNRQLHMAMKPAGVFLHSTTNASIPSRDFQTADSHKGDHACNGETTMHVFELNDDLLGIDHAPLPSDPLRPLGTQDSDSYAGLASNIGPVRHMDRSRYPING